MNDLDTTGFCECGCGERTTIAVSRGEGYAICQPRRFVHGHYHRWKRQNGCPGWGQPRRAKCQRIAERVVETVAPSRRDAVIGPAFDAAMECWNRSQLIEDLEFAARDGIRRHLLQTVRYGFGMSQREVARLYGVSLARIGQLERLALQKLQRAIEREAAARGVTAGEWLGTQLIM